ncbi:MAG: DUF4411 family protein [Treponema sp.]|nr:DUF4411 family protein [Treponema sp.]
MYCLDTNVIIDSIRGNFPKVEAHFQNTDSFEIVIPSVVIAELEFGAQHSGNYERRKNQYLEFIAPYKIIPFARKEAVAYGAIRQQLATASNIIGPNDMLIAATALANNATVVTHNIDEFSRVQGLLVEDWR